MDYLYSLYDALVSISVPIDKARAVIDAMERDMGSTLATKSDLEFLRLEVRQELALVRKDMDILAANLRKDMDAMATDLRKDMGALATDLRKDMDTLATDLRKEIHTLGKDFRKDMDLLSTRMTVRLGSMLMLGLGLLFAALKIT